MAALFRDAVADSPNGAKEFVFHGNLSAHQFERRANDRCGKSSPAANATNLIDNRRIRDVPAIPCQKEVHPVNGCNRNVHGVRRGLPRNQSAPENRFRQILRRTGHFQDRAIFEGEVNGVRSRHSTFALWPNAFAELNRPEVDTPSPSSGPTLAPAPALARGTLGAAVGSPVGFNPRPNHRQGH